MATRISLVVLLGTVAAAGAAAKELPRGWSEPRGVTGCEAFGPNFHKIEGTDTCIRIGGQVRMEQSFVTSGGSFTPSTRR